jgi:hypothetical protein
MCWIICGVVILKKLCVSMLLPILYVVFHHFSSMLPIVHVQSIYNVNKPVTTICMIFVDFFRFFLALQAPKSTESVLFEIGPVNQQNWSGYQNLVQFTDLIQPFHQFEFCIGFQPVLSVFGETGKTGPVRSGPVFRPMLIQGTSISFICFNLQQD